MLPRVGLFITSARSFPALTDQVREELESYLASDVEEPLGAELLREARELRFSNPRSALLIGVTAL
jgi:hypothetical protein